MSVVGGYTGNNKSNRRLVNGQWVDLNEYNNQNSGRPAFGAAAGVTPITIPSGYTAPIDVYKDVISDTGTTGSGTRNVTSAPPVNQTPGSFSTGGGNGAPPLISISGQVKTDRPDAASSSSANVGSVNDEKNAGIGLNVKDAYGSIAEGNSTTASESITSTGEGATGTVGDVTGWGDSDTGENDKSETTLSDFEQYYAPELERAAAERAKATEQVDVAYQRMLKYLPQTQKLAGLQGSGKGQYGTLEAYNTYLSNIGKINDSYNDTVAQYEAAYRDHLQKEEDKKKLEEETAHDEAFDLAKTLAPTFRSEAELNAYVESLGVELSDAEVDALNQLYNTAMNDRSNDAIITIKDQAYAHTDEFMRALDAYGLSVDANGKIVDDEGGIVYSADDLASLQVYYDTMINTPEQKALDEQRDKEEEAKKQARNLKYAPVTHATDDFLDYTRLTIFGKEYKADDFHENKSFSSAVYDELTAGITGNFVFMDGDKVVLKYNGSYYTLKADSGEENEFEDIKGLIQNGQKYAEEKAAQEKAAQEKAAQEKAAQEKAAQEKAAQGKQERENWDWFYNLMNVLF